MTLHAGNDIVADRHRKRIGTLEQHANASAQCQQIVMWRPNALVVESHITLTAKSSHPVVHPIERAEEGRLSRAGRTDQSRDRPPTKGHVDVGKDGLGAKTQAELLGLDNVLGPATIGVERFENLISRVDHGWPDLALVNSGG